jgi:hypothetical protein
MVTGAPVQIIENADDMWQIGFGESCLERCAAFEPARSPGFSGNRQAAVEVILPGPWIHQKCLF